jgi:hypothetical protein
MSAGSGSSVQLSLGELGGELRDKRRVLIRRYTVLECHQQVCEIIGD